MLHYYLTHMIIRDKVINQSTLQGLFTSDWNFKLDPGHHCSLHWPSYIFNNV